MLADCLMLLADVDDIQSAVCILIALGDRRKDLPLDEIVHVNILAKINTLQKKENTQIFIRFSYFLAGILAIIIHRLAAASSVLERGNGDCKTIMVAVRV